jgi:hypothetical protein
MIETRAKCGFGLPIFAVLIYVADQRKANGLTAALDRVRPAVGLELCSRARQKLLRNLNILQYKLEKDCHLLSRDMLYHKTIWSAESHFRFYFPPQADTQEKG